MMSRKGQNMVVTIIIGMVILLAVGFAIYYGFTQVWGKATDDSCSANFGEPSNIYFVSGELRHDVKDEGFEYCYVKGTLTDEQRLQIAAEHASSGDGKSIPCHPDITSLPDEAIVICNGKQMVQGRATWPVGETTELKMYYNGKASECRYSLYKDSDAAPVKEKRGVCSDRSGLKFTYEPQSADTGYELDVIVYEKGQYREETKLDVDTWMESAKINIAFGTGGSSSGGPDVQDNGGSNSGSQGSTTTWKTLGSTGWEGCDSFEENPAVLQAKLKPFFEFNGFPVAPYQYRITMLLEGSYSSAFEERTYPITFTKKTGAMLQDTVYTKYLYLRESSSYEIDILHAKPPAYDDSPYLGTTVKFQAAINPQDMVQLTGREDPQARCRFILEQAELPTALPEEPSTEDETGASSINSNAPASVPPSSSNTGSNDNGGSETVSGAEDVLDYLDACAAGALSDPQNTCYCEFNWEAGPAVFENNPDNDEPTSVSVSLGGKSAVLENVALHQIIEVDGGFADFDKSYTVTGKGNGAEIAYAANRDRVEIEFNDGQDRILFGDTASLRFVNPYFQSNAAEVDLKIINRPLTSSEREDLCTSVEPSTGTGGSSSGTGDTDDSTSSAEVQVTYDIPYLEEGSSATLLANRLTRCAQSTDDNCFCENPSKTNGNTITPAMPESFVLYSQFGFDNPESPRGNNPVGLTDSIGRQFDLSTEQKYTITNPDTLKDESYLHEVPIQFCMYPDLASGEAEYDRWFGLDKGYFLGATYPKWSAKVYQSLHVDRLPDNKWRVSQCERFTGCTEHLFDGQIRFFKPPQQYRANSGSLGGNEYFITSPGEVDYQPGLCIQAQVQYGGARQTCSYP